MTHRVQPRDGRPPRTDDGRRLLVTDLDGTLVGDEAALRRFTDWLAPRRDQYLLAYATGRHWPDVAAPVEAGDLPRPDAVIAAVGTEVLAADGSPWPGWSERFDTAHGDRARAILAGLPFLTAQGPDRQSDLKASWYLAPAGEGAPQDQPRDEPRRPAPAPAQRPSFRATGRPAGRGLGTPQRRRHDHLTEIRDRLAEAGLAARLVVSASRYLDVLPPQSGKGAAARFLADALGFEASRVLVFGDSGNDAELLLGGFPATIVANAQPELASMRGPTIYHSPCPYADGVLDGIAHWTAAAALPRGLIQP